MKQFLLLFFLLTTATMLGQAVIPIPSGGTGTVRSVGCGNAIFTDSGGQSGRYAAGENGSITFCPVISTDKMVMNFTAMDLGPGDILTVFDGDSVGASVLTSFTNTITAPGIVTASAANTSGCLTFRFVSNATDNRAGWEARRSCSDPCQTITTTITTTPARDPDNILRICQGDTVDFEGQATFSADGSGASYQWDFDNGRGLNPGRIQSETFNNAGTYQVRFIARDNTGCTDRNLIDLVVQVSNDPDFTGTQAANTAICIGESTTLTGMVETVEFTVTAAPPITGTTFLPDGDGRSYTTCIDVDGFDPGATFNDASNLVSMFVNMEHSWTDDLSILLTAPNGSSVQILDDNSTGPNRRLGNPSFNDDDLNPNNQSRNPPGTGFEYIIRDGAPATRTFQNALRAISAGSSLPAGSYRANNTFAEFIGSNINGQWCLTVTDNLPRDNGYIFEWGLNFDPSLLPTDLSFTPSEVREEWLDDLTITARSGNTITVQPTTVGTKCYTYEFEDSFGCVYQQEVCIEVNPLPAPSAPIDILVCDTTGSVTTLDLTRNTPILLAGQSAADFRVQYHRNQADALALVNAITTPAQYPASTTPQAIYASITNSATGCSVVRDFQVSISKAIFNAVPNLVVCDDASNDGSEIFNLTAQSARILGTQSAAEVSITFHRTAAEASTDSNAITNPGSYSNENSPRQTVFVRVENNFDTNCFATGSFDLVVGGNPVANAILEYALCDDTSNDGFENFVLGSRDTQILGTQDPMAFEVTYYISQNDANLRQNPLNKTVYRNNSRSQAIVARVESRVNNACFQTVSFNVIVQPKPVIALAANLVKCDDPSGDGMEDFDLSTNNNTILNGLPAADYRITFHLSQVNANNGTASLPINYTSNQRTTDIFVRVENSLTGCFSTTSYQIQIDPVPTTVAVPILETCDDDGDGTSQFRLNDRRSQILNGQTGITVNYFESRAAALSGIGALDAESYTNTTTTETIFYRSQFNTTGCFTINSFNIATVAPPIAGTPSVIELCDSGDGTAAYNLANSDGDIINGQTNTVVSYYRSQSDAFNANNPLNVNFTLTQNTIVYARLESGGTGCFDTIALELRFGELPQPQLLDEIVLCRDPQGQLVNGPAVLDTGLSDLDFNFEWRFEGQLLPTENSSTLITEQQGIYEVTAFNNNTGCSAIDSTLVRLAGAPDTFTINVTSQPFDDNQRIEITAQGPDEYWFQLDDGLFQDSPIFENVRPGLRTITIAERTGCGAVSSQVFVYGYPKFFTPNADGFNDTWNVSFDSFTDSTDNPAILNIYIFDRYGKLLKQLNPTGTGWDGTYRGELMPSSDYWFKLEYDFGTVRGTTNGHFSLKR